jgi:hypothetical protein
MREEGIDMPDPEVDGGRITMRRPGPGGGGASDGPGSPAFERAQRACEEHMPRRPEAP